VTAAVNAGERWLNQVGSGLPRMLRLVLSIALAVVLVDHVAKLGAAWVEPEYYMHNPAPMDYDWVMLVPFLALLFPSRVVAGLFAVLLGGAVSNVIDVYLWPGGVPDFIPMGDWIWNPADFAIYGATFALMGWPVWKLFQVARRKYPERVSIPVAPVVDPARPMTYPSATALGIRRSFSGPLCEGTADAGATPLRRVLDERDGSADARQMA
jgi:hypothetical protein